MLEKIKNWWRGEEYYIEGVLPGIRYNLHWTSKTVHIFWKFYLNNWKWLWTSIIAVLALIFVK